MSAIAQWIAQLADADRVTREEAAAGLYAAGRALGDAAVAAWRTDAEVAALFIAPATVGIAVHPNNLEAIRAAMGAPRLANVPADQDAREFELRIVGTRMDILTTRAPGGGGAIDRFLQKFGEGIQQVEYPVSSVERATELLRARFGLQPIYPQTRAGADGTRVNFFLASTPDGRKVLIELVEG